ncbi:MAG: DEAD/DEAH box helicase, partial [Calditrichaeota bacterium]
MPEQLEAQQIDRYMLKLKSLLYALPEFTRLESCLNRQGPVHVRGISGSLLAVVINFIREVSRTPQIVVMPEGEDAEKLVDDLQAFLPAGEAVYFPSDEVVPFDRGTFAPALYSRRMNALATVLESREVVLVTTPPALLRRVPAPGAFARNIVHLKVGEEFERELLIEWLAESGYQRVDIVDEIGQFSVRGGILDVFSLESEVPHRLEFFGDTIESIREFDVLSQLSTGQVERIRLLGKSPDEPDRGTLFEYFPEGAFLFWQDAERCHQRLNEWWEEARARFEERREELDIHHLDEYYRPLPDLPPLLKNFREIRHTHFSGGQAPDVHFHATPPPVFHGNMKLFVEHLQRHLVRPAREADRREIYLLHEGKGSRERLEEILEAEMGEVPPLHFLEGELHQGFALPEHGLEILTDHEIFNRLRMRRRRRRLRVSASLVRSLQSLEPGDIVVHVDYGIGKYMGTERITVAGMEKECIKLLYDNNDVLYVTLDKLNRIQRYVSEEGYKPRLTRLGSLEWERVKKRTRKAVETIARELVELYAQRQTHTGHAFSPDSLWQKELEASFPYEETPDQARAVEEVKRDMESPRPMDRLICGDVGYGKTEVAIRAAFKAVLDGKQVAVLVPTTILAQQHYDTFRERMANFPVRVEMVSRFRTPGEQKKIL